MAAVIGAEDDVAIAGEPVHVGHVALGRAILVRRDEAVIENDRRPAGGGRLAKGDGKQGVDPQPFGPIGSQIAIVVRPRGEDFLDVDDAAGELRVAQEGN